MAEGVRMRQEAAAYHAAHIRGRGRCQGARQLELGGTKKQNKKKS